MSNIFSFIRYGCESAKTYIYLIQSPEKALLRIYPGTLKRDFLIL